MSIENCPHWMPWPVFAACVERGLSDERIIDLTPRQALVEYTAWHLGDSNWGRDLFDYAEMMIDRKTPDKSGVAT